MGAISGEVSPAARLALDRACVRACRLAYDREAPDYAYGCSEAVLVRDEQATPILAVRGTTLDGWGLVFRDLAIDALAYPWPTDRLGWVHKGFFRGRAFGELPGGAAGLYRDARRDLAMYGPHRLVLTGHSKGGAEALIVGALLTLDGLPPKAVVTFGCPRAAMGGRFFEVLAGVPLRRYAVAGDLVPRIPALLPWRHPDERRGAPPWHTVRTVDRRTRPWPNVSDHRLAGYQAAMDALVKEAA